MRSGLRQWLLRHRLVLMALACLVVATAAAVLYLTAEDCYEGKAPLRWVYVTVAADQTETVIAALRQYATQQRLRFGIQYYTLDHRYYSVTIHGDGYLVFAGNPLGPRLVKALFQNTDCRTPTVASDLDDDVAALVAALSEIPGAEVREVP